MNDHLAAPVRELLALYAERYSEVSFPDLDLSVLEAAAADVAKAADRVAEAEASIEPLREQMRAIEGELTQKVVRALAFLKVYVEGDEAEYARLDALTQSLLSRRGPRKTADSKVVPGGERTRRGRKSKASADALAEVSAVTLSAGEIAEADLPSSALTEFEVAAEE
jgi:hypothetical protein